MNIAIIPARSGSKRIPEKNIRKFCGKPMIAYAIDAAKKSDLFRHIFVSTNDENIAGIAIEYGAQVPFLRPDDLADDFSTTVEVVSHEIKQYLAAGYTFDRVCCIYPCVPFIEVDDLRGALGEFIKGGTDYCFPVAEYPSAIQRALKLLSDKSLTPFYPSHEKTRTQDLEAAFYDVGQFYWGQVEAWAQNGNIHSNALGWVIPNWRVVDIDVPDDWRRAELIFRAMHMNEIIFGLGGHDEL